MRQYLMLFVALSSLLCALVNAQEADDWEEYSDDAVPWQTSETARPATWGRIEYLMFFSHGRNVPALASTSVAGTSAGEAGVLPSFGNGEVLFGNDRIGTAIRSGGRATIGAALDDERIFSVQARYFQLEQSQATGHFAVDNNSILARPFFRSDVNPFFNHEDSALITYPGLTRGGRIDIKDASDYISGDVGVKAIFWDDGVHRFDLLGGFQQSRIDNSLEIHSSQVAIAPPLAPTQVGVYDLFDTQNHFYGAQFGVAYTCSTESLSLELGARMGLGNQFEKLHIHGTTDLTLVGTTNTTTFNSGLLAAETNSGTYTRNRLVFSPEVNANLAYHVRPNITLSFGYTFIYWSRVAMAGNNVDRVLNISRLAGSNTGDVRPAAFFHETDFWVMGLSWGAEYKF